MNWLVKALGELLELWSVAIAVLAGVSTTDRNQSAWESRLIQLSAVERHIHCNSKHAFRL
jgi:hypothetical protein